MPGLERTLSLAATPIPGGTAIPPAVTAPVSPAAVVGAEGSLGAGRVGVGRAVGDAGFGSLCERAGSSPGIDEAAYLEYERWLDEIYDEIEETW